MTANSPAFSKKLLGDTSLCGVWCIKAGPEVKPSQEGDACCYTVALACQGRPLRVGAGWRWAPLRVGTGWG